MKHFRGPCCPFLSELSILTCHQLDKKHTWLCLLIFGHFCEASMWISSYPQLEMPTKKDCSHFFIFIEKWHGEGNTMSACIHKKKIQETRSRTDINTFRETSLKFGLPNMQVNPVTALRTGCSPLRPLPDGGLMCAAPSCFWEEWHQWRWYPWSRNAATSHIVN